MSTSEITPLRVSGNCYEELKNVPPRGLELELLAQGSSKASTDTIVMSNLGYFQLKASPALWNLSIRPGR